MSLGRPAATSNSTYFFLEGLGFRAFGVLGFRVKEPKAQIMIEHPQPGSIPSSIHPKLQTLVQQTTS